jgi:hypothetical protein
LGISPRQRLQLDEMFMIRLLAPPAMLLALGYAGSAQAQRPRATFTAAVVRSSGGGAIVPTYLTSAAILGARFGIVTSTYRSVEHNRAVGGMPNSYHLQGRAIDIARRPGVTHAQIDFALRRAGFLLVESLDEGDHSHFAFAGAGMPRISPPAVITAEASQAVAAAAPAPIHRLAADEHGTLEVVSAVAARVSGHPTERMTR